MFKKETRKQTTKPKPLWPLVFRRFSPPRLGRFNFLAPTPVFLKASQGRWEAGGGGAGRPVHHGGFVLPALLLGLDSLIPPRLD